jgi:hypothetical protein
MDPVKPGVSYWKLVSAKKDHSGDFCCASEYGFVKAPVPQFGESYLEFLRHIHAAASAVLWRAERPVDRVAGSPHMQKPVLIALALPKLDIVPEEPECFPSTHSSTG